MFGTLKYTGTLDLGEVKAPGVYIEINCYHIHIYDSKTHKELWKRTPDMNEWLDEKHSKMVAGLDQLEKVLKEIS